MNNRHFLPGAQPLPYFPPAPRFQLGPPVPLPPQFQLRPLTTVPYRSKNSPLFSGQIALQIRGFSPAVAYHEREHLLHGLGATTVHNAPFHSVAFFECNASAQAVIRRLHQRPWTTPKHFKALPGDNSLLRVEYLSPKLKTTTCIINAHRPCDSSLKRLITAEQQQCFFGNLYEGDHQQTSSSSSASSNFCFPPATASVVRRISRQLLEDDHFYQQVLQLMLRLGYRPPFDEDNPADETEEENDDLSGIHLPSSSPPQSKRPHHDDLASDESELETEAVVVSSATKQFYHLPKRRKRKKLKTGLVGEKAALLLPQSITSSSKNCSTETAPLTTTIEAAFEDVPSSLAFQQPKLIKVAPLVSSSSTANPSSPLVTESSQPFGTLSSLKKLLLPSQPPPSTSISFDLASLTLADLVTEEELKSHKLPPSEWPNYKVFAGYRLNPVCNRLYVKNLHRSVTLRDLYRLFGRWCDLTKVDQLKAFNIVKLDRGRMRGQAFISLPTEAAAVEAIHATNGYVGLYADGGGELRPIVVNFALSKRSSAEAEA